MAAPPRTLRAVRAVRGSPMPWWRVYAPVLLPATIALLLLLTGNRAQWGVMRALRVTVLYPATAIDNAIRDAVRVRSQNRELRYELGVARTRLAATAGAPPPAATAAAWTEARVVGRGQSADGNWNYLTVRPTDAQIDTIPPTLALTPNGLVGAVVERGWGTLIVRSIAAPKSAVHVLNQRSRVAGVIRSEADVGVTLRLHHVPAQADVAVGDTLITSGFGLLFPPDIPVGRVTRVLTPDEGLIQDVWVEPFVHLERLEHVFLTGRTPPW